MKENLTEMVFILDRSGSMVGLETDTIGGFNSMIEKQKAIEGEAIISTVLFDHEVEVLHDRINLKGIKSITAKEYYTRGMTALLDAVGRSIRHIRRIYAETLREERPSKVVFVITTDGMENSSVEYSYAQVKAMIEEMKEKYKWEFLFLGANIDAIDEARKFGIDEHHSVNYKATHEGVRDHYNAVNEAMSSMRITNQIKKDWKKKIS